MIEGSARARFEALSIKCRAFSARIEALEFRADGFEKWADSTSKHVNEAFNKFGGNVTESFMKCSEALLESAKRIAALEAAAITNGVATAAPQTLQKRNTMSSVVKEGLEAIIILGKHHISPIDMQLIIAIQINQMGTIVEAGRFYNWKDLGAFLDFVEVLGRVLDAAESGQSASIRIVAISALQLMPLYIAPDDMDADNTTPKKEKPEEDPGSIAADPKFMLMSKDDGTSPPPRTG